LPAKPLSAQGKQRKLLFSKTEAFLTGLLGVLMSLRYVVRVLLLAGLAPSAVLALGLGDIHLNSPLNAPLVADIDLSASPEELDGLKVTLASRETFTRYGLDYPTFLGSITVVPGKNAAGHDVLQLRSRDAITEPFATLLVEANWPRGRLVREYTVLLDPPTFTGAQGNPAAVAAPATGQAARAGAVERAPVPAAAQPPAAATAPRAAAPMTPAPVERAAAPVAAPVAAAVAGAADYLVRRGDTLSSIVAGHYNNGERDRALVAAFQANPAAFAGNMNVLKAGATLHLPDSATVAAIGPAEATAEVATQYHDWSPAHGGGQLKLVAPDATPAQAAAKPTEPLAQPKGSAPDAIEARRLLELKSAELARLQAQAAKPPVATPAPVPAAPPVAPAVQAPAPEAPPAAEAPKPLPKPVVAPPAATNGVVDMLADNWLYLVGALLLIAVALGAMSLARKRQSQRMDRTFEHFTSPPPELMTRSVRSSESTTPIKALRARDDQGFLVEESGTHEILALDQSVMSDSVVSDSAVPAESTVSLEQGDPLAEADFHMAYGLYDQAADLVRLGISREPGRHDLKLKLLEVYFVWGNKDQFLQLARELSTNRVGTPAGEWEKVLIMGRQIAADDPLFSNNDKVTGAAAGGVDLNLEGGQNHVDFDLLGEPSMSAGRPVEDVDLDLGTALARESEAPTGEARSIGDTGVDFILDDPQRGADGTGVTREMPQQSDTLDFLSDALFPGEAPTIEQPRLPAEENNTLRTKLDASSRTLLAGVDQTTELALDDLGLDLSADATGLHSLPPLEDVTGSNLAEPGDSAPTQLTSLNDETRSLLARAEGESGRSQAERGSTRELPAGNPGASGTWLISDHDFSEMMPALPEPADHGADAPTQVISRLSQDTSDTAMGLGLTSQIESLRASGANVDLNLDGLDGLDPTASTGQVPELDLDLGAATMQSESRFSDTQRLDAIQLPAAANEPEPATMSEVGTKLDLARAYMDMGDPEGARSILDEVISEGSASQKTEARRLIDSLPG
jgi:pilus assembly protein FimV